MTKKNRVLGLGKCLLGKKSAREEGLRPKQRFKTLIFLLKSCLQRVKLHLEQIF